MSVQQTSTHTGTCMQWSKPSSAYTRNKLNFSFHSLSPINRAHSVAKQHSNVIVILRSKQWHKPAHVHTLVHTFYRLMMSIVRSIAVWKIGLAQLEVQVATNHQFTLCWEREGTLGALRVHTTLLSTHLYTCQTSWTGTPREPSLQSRHRWDILKLKFPFFSDCMVCWQYMIGYSFFATESNTCTIYHSCMVLHLSGTAWLRYKTLIRVHEMHGRMPPN